MTALHWQYQDQPLAAWVARTAGGRYEIRVSTCSYAFIEHDRIRQVVRWHAARSLEDARERCALLHRDSDDQASARTVAIEPGKL